MNTIDSFIAYVRRICHVHVVLVELLFNTSADIHRMEKEKPIGVTFSSRVLVSCIYYLFLEHI